MNDTPTSLTLLQRIRNHDEDAWPRMMGLYCPMVERWCASQGVKGQDADDVIQEVFKSVATSLDSFRRDRPDDTFRGWLRAITRHKLLDHFRRNAHHPQAQGGTEAHRQLEQWAEAEFPDDSDQDLTALYHRGLELVRAEFEARTWDAFWRVTVDGQSPALVAQELGVTPAAVRKAKSRVLYRLRQELGDIMD